MRKRKKKRTKIRYSDQFVRTQRRKLGIKPLREVKDKAVVKAYEACKRDAVLAAVLLGIGKTTLYRDLNRINKT